MWRLITLVWFVPISASGAWFGDLICVLILWTCLEKQKHKGQGDQEGEKCGWREGGRARALDASEFPNSLLFSFFSLLFILPHPSMSVSHPTPSCSLLLFLSTASYRHLLFVWRGLTRGTIQSVFPKISQWERDRGVSQGNWSSEVHSPWL